MAGDLTDSQRAFVQTYTPLAQDIASRTGLFPEVVLGQIAQETGWGTRAKGSNLFGISRGGSVVSYPSAEHAGQAYVDLINTPRYKNVAQAKTPEEQAAALVKGGYNTADPNYAKSVGTIARLIAPASEEHQANADKDWLRGNQQAPSPTNAAPALSPQQPGQSTDQNEAEAASNEAYLRQGQAATPPPEDTPMSRSQGQPISENRKPGMADQAVINLSTDPAQKLRIAASRLFPDDPNGVQRLGYDKDNRMYAVGPDDKPYYVDPLSPHVNFGPLSHLMRATMPGQWHRLFTETPGEVSEPSRVGNPFLWAARNAGGALPVAGGIGLGLAALPTSLVAGPGMAAAGAAAGDFARQRAARYFDPSPTPPPTDYGSIAREAALSGAGQILGAGAARLINRNPLGLSAGEVNLLRQPGGITQEAKEAYARAEAQGVPLSLGQATGLQRLLQIEDAAKNNPLLVDTPQAFYGRQGEAIGRAGQNMLNKVSRIADKNEGAQAFQAAAEDAIRLTRQNANREARPAYEAAQRAGQVLSPDLAQLMEQPAIADALKSARGSYRNLYRKEAPDVPDFALWDLAKRKLDDAHSIASRAGERTDAMAIDSLRGDLMTQLDAAFPTYASARAAAAPGQALAAQLGDSGLGAVAGKTGDEKARAILAPVFSGNNPDAIRRARTAFVDAGKADEWSAGVRSFLQDALDKSGKSLEGLNPARLHNELFGNVDTRKAIEAALTPAQYEGFENFVKTVGDAARTYPTNSLTAMRQRANETLLGTASNSPTVKAIRAARNLGTVTKWPDVFGRLVGGVEQRAIQRDMSRIIDNLFTPDGMKYLEEMSKYSPGSARMVNATGQIIGRSLPNPLAPEAGAANPLLVLPAPPSPPSVGR